MEKYKVVNGRWQIGNLNDSLTMSGFNYFIRLHKNVRLVLKQKTKCRLSKEFISKNQHIFNEHYY